MFKFSLILFLAVFWAFGAYPQAAFRNDAAQFQIQHALTSTNNYGSGLSFYDFNNDGHDDLTLILENDSILFYINTGETFTRHSFGIFNGGETKQVLWADYDNDGDNDLLITTYNGVFKLLQNNGHFQFSDMTQLAGLTNDPSANYGACFGDINNDGFLDLYVCRYPTAVMNDSTNINHVNLLYLNNRSGGFSNISFSSGTSDGLKPSFQSVFLDFDKDGLTDIYVINDKTTFSNSLYKNNGNLTFTNVAAAVGADLPGNSPMSATVGDFDNNGWLDIYMSNGGWGTNGLLLVNNQGTFTERAAHFNVDIDRFSWGAVFADIDNDTYLDLFVTTGDNSVDNVFYLNNQGQSFSQQSYLDAPQLSQSFAVARGDYNNDGKPDLFVVNAHPSMSMLLTNTFSHLDPKHFAKFTLQGSVSNKMAIGSWISIYSNSTVQTRYLLCGENYLSQNSLHQHVGVDEAQIIDSVVVTYPSGISDRYFNLSVDSHYHFVEGETFSNRIRYSSSLRFCTGDSITLDAGNFQTYSWSNGSNQRYIKVHQSGSFWVVVTNENNLQIKSDTVVTQVSPIPIISYLIRQPRCENTNDGRITLLIENIAGQSRIEWNQGSTGNVLDSLTDGIYSFRYSDEFNCIVNDSINIFAPFPIEIQYQIIQNSNNLSTIHWVINGGTPPYVVLLNNIEFIDSAQNLQEGLYSLRVIDRNSCLHAIEIPVVVGLHDQDGTKFPAVTIWPNPTHENTVWVKESTMIENIECYNTNGKSVDCKWLNSTLQLPQDQKGVTLIKIKTIKGTTIKYLVKH